MTYFWVFLAFSVIGSSFSHHSLSVSPKPGWLWARLRRILDLLLWEEER